jgi:hypothetical protein
MTLEISTDSESWLHVKHALREAGLKYYLQEQMFTPNKSLFVEPRAPEPEGGKLSHGLIVYEGGSAINSAVAEAYEKQTCTKCHTEKSVVGQFEF